MNKAIMFWAFSLTILLSAYEKDLIKSTIDEANSTNVQLQSTEDLSLRKGNYKIIDQLKRVIEEPGLPLSLQL